MKKVSIITPCFNCQEFLEETFTTVTQQNYQNWEWILVDDCSTDSSYEKLQELSSRDERIRVFKNEDNCGAAVTRNVGLDQATGDYVAFLDSDDLWHPEKLEVQIRQMVENSIEFSYHDYDTVDEAGNHLKEQKLKSSYTAKDLLKYNPFATSSIVIRRELIVSNRIRFKEHLKRRQDYFFWYDSIAASKVVKGIGQALSRYRLGNSNSLSSNKVQMAKIQWKLYREEFNLGFFQSAYYTLHYAVHGVKKYFLS